MGYRFHVTQGWWRAIQRFGLTEKYKIDLKFALD